MAFAAEHDVVILGAGPAGASAAIRLAQIGLDVGLVERRPFPRGHVGICISDGTLPLIDYLGLGQQFDTARFWRRNLTAVKWENSEARLVPQQGYHVDRAVFDELMLCRARSEGATIYHPVQVQDVERLEDSGWRVAIACDERRLLLRGRFIVDAAGRRPAVRGVRVKDGPPLVAVHANWTLGATVEFDGLIEAGEDAWLWYAQTARNRAVVSVFCDPRRLKTTSRGRVQARYSSLLRQFRTLKPEHLGTQCSDPTACDATSHHAQDPVGDQYIRLGDSCFSVDPLASQGVHLALQSGLQGAIIVNTILRKPENAEIARRFFQLRTAQLIGLHTSRTQQEYSRMSAVCSNAFWYTRAGDISSVDMDGPSSSVGPTPPGPSDQVVISPLTMLDAAPVIKGLFVEVREVVRHPDIDGAIAYVEDVDLVRLLSVLPAKVAYADIPEIWRDQISPRIGAMIASWLWNKRILVRST